MHTPTGNKTANGLTSKAININRRPTNNCGCCRLPEHHCRRLIYIEYESGWLVGWADKHVIHLIKDICNANWVCEHMLFAHDAQRKPAQSKANRSTLIPSNEYLRHHLVWFQNCKLSIGWPKKTVNVCLLPSCESKQTRLRNQFPLNRTEPNRTDFVLGVIPFGDVQMSFYTSPLIWTIALRILWTNICVCVLELGVSSAGCPPN